MNKENVFLNFLKNDDYVNSLIKKIIQLKQTREIYPVLKNVFRAFKLTNLDDVKIVIFGQDPYYQPNVADGLAFSTNDAIPPISLKNIFIELKNEFKDIVLETNSLEYWAKQGVLLLNRTLTVERYKPNSHKNLGWDYVVKKAIDYINRNLEKVVFLLWGNEAKSLESFINQNKHYILKSPHPSSYSASMGFFGNNHFKMSNEILIKNNKSPIDWNLKLEKK